MACISPYTVDSKKINGIHTQDRRYSVPCGRCADCLKRRVNDWKFRLFYEERSAQCTMFVTLTYNNQHVPISPMGKMTLDKPRWDVSDDIRIITRGKNAGKRKLRDDHITSFLKRLRIIQDRDKETPDNWPKIKYYANGEYGELYHRPHHHLILFNVHNPEFVGKAWRYGEVDIQLRPKTGAFAYTAGYINKTTEKVGQDPEDDRVPEFSRMSKGIGQSYVTAESIKHHKSNLYQNNYVVLDGIKQPMPKYLKQKIYNDIERQQLAEYAEYLNHAEWDDLFLKEGNLIFEILKSQKDAKIAKHKSLNNKKRIKDGTGKFEAVQNSTKLRRNNRR